MSDTFTMPFDLPSGEVSEPTSYVPVPEGRYQARIGGIDFTDPVSLGWKARSDDPEKAKAELAPFVRVRWEVVGDEAGMPVEATGRRVEQRVSLGSGRVDKQGIPESKVRADLIRLRHNLTAKDEVVGKALYDLAAVTGMSREDAAQELSKQLREAYVGLTANIRVYNFDGSAGKRDGVGGILLPKE